MRHYRGFWILLPALTLSCQTQAPDKVEIPPVNNTAHDLLPYPEPDAYLGESLHDGELDVAKKIPDVIHQNIRSQSTSEQRFQGKSLLTHGCVNAEFVVDPGINPALAKGVFSSQGAYEATVRFLGTNADPKSAKLWKTNNA
ncbi:MAG: hypothetical protein H7249_05760 [Chitinophagaceae bacterium]|nr:hypothetical protein [Oligoflexus sp.]